MIEQPHASPGRRPGADSTDSSVPVAVITVDQHGVVTLAQGDALASLGLRDECLTGRPMSEALHCAPALVEAMRRVLEEGQTVGDIELEDGALRLQCRPLRALSGEVTGGIAVVQNVGTVLRLQESLRCSQEHQARLVREKEVLAEVGRIVSSSLDVEELYQRFAGLVGRLADFDRMSISTGDFDSGSLTVAFTTGMKVEGRQVGAT